MPRVALGENMEAAREDSHTYFAHNLEEVSVKEKTQCVSSFLSQLSW